MSHQAVILAAGKGTRMKSDLAKVMHPVLGRPLIGWVTEGALEAGAERVVVIVGHQRESVESYLHERFGERVAFAVQDEQLGTGHAVWCAREFLQDDAPERTIILSGDVPNLLPATIAAFVKNVGDSDLGVMTAILDEPAKYGRIKRSASGSRVTGIVEWADASDAEREIREINAGVYVVDTDFLRDELEALCTGPANTAQGEYYLTDLVAVAAENGQATAWILDDVDQVQGVNTRAHLAEAMRWRRGLVNQRWMEAGVTMLDPATTYVDADVQLGEDVTLHPSVELRGATRVGARTVIEQSCTIVDTTIGDDVHVKPFCHFEEARVEDGAIMGSFCHLRPGADIGPDCHVGNFVEVKKTRMDQGAKANHHSYLGDGHVGARSNVGAGTIFCNYDGTNKHRTVLGEGVFIGSNSALVAPVTIGDGAYVAAGSVVTEDVPAKALAVARGRQRNVDGWADRE